MDIAPELTKMLITIIYLITTIVLWRKRFIRRLLLLVFLLIIVKLTYNYFDNTFIVKHYPIFKFDSISKNYNYEKIFIDNLKDLTDDHIKDIMTETIGNFNYPVAKFCIGYDGYNFGPLIIKYPKYFMTEEQKIFHIINQLIQERLPYVNFKNIHFSLKTSIGYFLYISIEIPKVEIPEKYFKVKKKFLQMFISLDDKYIFWNNL
ncbi:MAG: hypothetical protein ACD_59C00025G0002 [uncultured bacterium]|nr:MAG: hypothetical protein ACD_59C00025G0002 [uncultured bacterium]